MHDAIALALAASLLAGAPPARTARPGSVEAAETWLASLCRTYSADPEIPWALGHGIETFGPKLRASDGRLAIDVMVSDFVERKGVGAQALYRFPPNRGSIPVDPHANHTVMKLVRSQVPMMRVFETKDGPLALAQLVDSIKRDFRFAPSDEFWREHAWTLMALASSTREDEASWQNRFGETINLAQVLDATVAHLGDQHRFLETALAEGVALVPKRKQFIWNHPCGGLHLVQAAFAWMDQPKFRERHLAAAKTQVDILFYRLDIETRAYDQALDLAPEYALQLNVQRLKFYGHWLETAMHLRELDLWEPTPERLASVAKARKLIAKTVEALREQRVGERMAEFKSVQRQTYFDLIGDSCHAASGLKASR
ncbi:MAG: hypothetical protein ACOX6T_21155 [Myxococcales bacterium]